MYLQKLIEKHWYVKNNLLLCVLLLPFSLIFFIISQIRYLMYKSGILKRYKLPVPVVIIGNISVGGAGKTPLTKYMAIELGKRGISVGVILRGYRSRNKSAVIVNANDDSTMVGDEALIYARNNIRVAIGRNRYRAGLELLNKYPDIQLILADDGMQHYRLQRDFEVAVIDSSRMLGNSFVLPLGPLREIPSRLKQVNAIVFTGKIPDTIRKYRYFPSMVVEQKLILDKIYNPMTKTTITINELKQQQVAAMAAIGNPQRFFDFIKNLGITLNVSLAFPDHYSYNRNDIPDEYPIILVTEKDYAKLSGLNNAKIWIVFVKTKLDNDQLLMQLMHLTTKGNDLLC